MKKLIIAIFIFLCTGYGIDYSLRIKALGSDFAYLIPDYETDLALDPNLLGNKLIGISYDPQQDIRLMLTALTKRFGWMGKYWFYRSEYSAPYDYSSYMTFIQVDDSWYLDLRGKLPKFLADNVWNLSNDCRYHYDYDRHYGSYDETLDLKYLIKTSDAYKIGEFMKLCLRGGYGLYLCDQEVNYDSIPTHFNRWLGFFTPRIGLFYKRIHGPNRFTSCYLDIGGPISVNDIDRLPYSILNHVPVGGYDIDLLFFIRNMISKAGWVNGYPLSDNSFVAIGLVDEFMFQYLKTEDNFLRMTDLKNVLSLPVAIEIQVGRCAIRAGANCCYRYKRGETLYQDSVIIKTKDHLMWIGYSFGLQVNLSGDRSVKLDLLSSNDISYISNWSVYLKKEW